MKSENHQEVFDKSIIIMLHKLSHHIYLKHNENLAKYGVTVQQSRALKYIIVNGENGSVNQKDIEKLMDLKGSSVSILIKTMIDKGLISKIQNPMDGRYYNLTATEKGIDLEKITFDLFKEFNTDLVKGIDENDLNHLKNTLKLIEQNI